MQKFTLEEQRILAPFMSNLDKPVFALRNLPEVVKGALFSRYSRSAKSLREVLLREFIQNPDMHFSDIVGERKNAVDQIVATKKAEEFYDRVLVGFGDDSVAELGGAHVACENVSNIASKVLEDSRIGLSPLEKSTRYVPFHQKTDGSYLYYKDPDIMASNFAEDYVGICDHLFDTYASLLEPVQEWVKKECPQGECVTDRAYQSAAKAKALDIIRNLLPAATLTNVGIFGNGRAFEYLITKLFAHPLREMQELGRSMYVELSKIIPSFVKRCVPEDTYGASGISYFKETRGATEFWVCDRLSGEERTYAGGKAEPVVKLVHYDNDAEVKVLAAAIFPFSSLPLIVLEERVRKMSISERKEFIRAQLGNRKNRRHKPSRAFENATYTFEMLTNYGAYRDIQRHRMNTQEHQDLTCAHGYDMPKELVMAGCEKHFAEAMERAATVFQKIVKQFPKQAQYVVPFAYRFRWYMTMNVREAYHFAELRSMRQGHTDYRVIAQEVYRKISATHPALSEYMKFVDMNNYFLERIEAEQKIDQKMQQLSRKYGS